MVVTDPGHPDDPTDWRHQTARVNGIDLHYVTVDPDPAAVDHPTGDAPLVVLLHGFPEFWYAWRHQLDALADAGYRVVAPDLRGYNRSSQPAGVKNYGMAELVGDVRGLVEHLGYGRAAIVGHDWGGVIAWEVAMRDPDLVSQLAILNSPHPEVFQETLSRSPRQLLKSWYIFLFQLPWLPERILAAGDYRTVGEMLGDTTTPDAFTDDDIRRYKDAMARSGSMTGPVNYYRAGVRENAERTLRSRLPGLETPRRTVDVPTLLIWGEDDAALSTALVDGHDEYVDDLRIERLPAASHWVQADAPDQVTALLVEFLI
jgi:pimeloyl-ACP methyl ester carboxylesterase